MAKTPTDMSTITAPEARELVKTTKKELDAALFEPAVSDEKLKARFWEKFHGRASMVDPSSLTASEIAKVTGSTTISKKWSKPGFKEWFLNQDEERQKIRFLFNKGLSVAEDMLLNPETNANAKVNLIKMLAEITGHLNKGNHAEKFADEAIGKMSQDQLEDYLKNKGVKITTETIIDTKAESDVE